MNIRSIRSKIDELRLLCSEAIPKIDCLCITESHLTSFDPDQLVYIPGYIIYRLDRVDQAGGGVLIYASDLYISSQLKQLHVDTIESLWVEFKYKSCRPIIVSCIYRPPKSDVVWFDHFEYILHEVHKLKTILL